MLTSGGIVENMPPGPGTGNGYAGMIQGAGTIRVEGEVYGCWLSVIGCWFGARGTDQGSPIADQRSRILIAVH